MSEDIVPAAVFYATVTPLVAWFVLKKAIIEPMNAEQKQRDIDRIKETNKKRYDNELQQYQCHHIEDFTENLQFRFELECQRKREKQKQLSI